MKRIALAALLLTILSGVGWSDPFGEVPPKDYPSAGVSISTGSGWGASKTSPSGDMVGTTDTQTLTNKRIDKRFLSISSAASITPNLNTQDGAYMNCTEGAGTFTINAPTGTPTPGQIWVFILQSTNAQTLSWNSAWASTTDYTRPATIGAGKAIVFNFLYEPINTTWYLVGLTNIK